MAIRLPDWINVEQGLGDLSELVPKLQIYAEFAANWREIGAQVWALGAGAPVDSPVNLVTYLAGKIDDPAIVEGFAALGLAELRQKLAGVSHDFTDPEAPWAKLLRPAADFAEAYGEAPGDETALDEGDNPGLVALTIPKLAADGATGVGKGSLTFGIAAEAGLETEAGALWPFRRDPVAPGLLRIGADGEIRAKAGFGLPFGQIGSGSADVAASAAARLDFFFRPSKPSAPFAEALVPALTGIPNPLDLAQISHAVQLVGLEGLILACEGAASAGLAATVGLSRDIPEIASITAGLVAELSFKRNARWLLSLRRTDDGLHFTLSRNLSRERSWSVGIDIGIDYSGLARQVHDALIKADGLAQPLLAELRPFLSPGTYLAEHATGLLDAAVASIVNEPELTVALAQDFGLVLGSGEAKELALAGFVRDRIADFAADHAGGVLSEVEDWAKGIAGGLAGKFPALAEASLEDKLVARIKPLLGDVQQRFGNLVSSLVASEGLAAELKAAGVKLSSLEADADEKLGGLRKIVSEFDKFSRTVIERTAEGVEHKLHARFGWSETDTRGVQYELVGTFTDAGEDNAALWRALVTGRLEPFQRILSHPASAPAGLQLDPRSSLARFAGTSRGFALEIVVLGLSVSIASIIEGKARITVSAGGDVSVAAEGSATRSVDGFDEGRAASFVSAWDLALHKADGAGGGQRNLSVALAFDHSDKDLDAGEVKSFLGGLASQSLVEDSRVARALEIYQEWRATTPPGKDVKGRIDVAMTLTGTAVGRMVELGRRAGAKGSTNQLRLFTRAAQALLDAGVADADALERDTRAARKEFAQLAAVDDPYRIMFGLQEVDLTPPDRGTSHAHRYSAFRQIIPRALSFPRLLATMAQIYDAVPVGALQPDARWTEKDYARAEKAMAADARLWLRLNQKFVFWFKAGLHPAMLAFLRLLADTNRPLLVDGDPFAELDLRTATAESSALFAIAMRQRKDRVPVAV